MVLKGFVGSSVSNPRACVEISAPINALEFMSCRSVVPRVPSVGTVCEDCSRPVSERNEGSTLLDALCREYRVRAPDHHWVWRCLTCADHVMWTYGRRTCWDCGRMAPGSFKLPGDRPTVCIRLVGFETPVLREDTAKDRCHECVQALLDNLHTHRSRSNYDIILLASPGWPIGTDFNPILIDEHMSQNPMWFTTSTSPRVPRGMEQWVDKGDGSGLQQPEERDRSRSPRVYASKYLRIHTTPSVPSVNF